MNHEPQPAQSRPGPFRHKLLYGGWRAVYAVILCAVLVGCQGVGRGGPPLGSIGHVRGFIGGVAVDGPRAALVARNMLSAGGTAADAAVTAAFMLTATYPVAASLAGGGRCLVFDGPREVVEIIDFPVRPAAAGGPVPVPGLVRGLALLHASHGRLAWSQLVSPAEQVARFGERISRAYASALRVPGVANHLDPSARAALALGADGRPLDEGVPHEQAALAATLSRIRIVGVGDFYSGLLARSFVSDAELAGGRLTIEDMRGYSPEVRSPQSRPFDAYSVYFAGDATPAMLAAWDQVVTRRIALLSDTADMQALPAALARNLPSASIGGTPEQEVAGLGTVTVAAMDREGQAVACSLTLGAPFGSGVMAQSTGVMLATLPQPGAPSQSALAVVGSPASWRLRGAFAASSGNLSGAAPAALMETMLPVLSDGGSPTVAAQGRYRYAAGGEAIAVEPGLLEAGAPTDERQALQALGRPMVPRAGIGRVNIAYCPDGVPGENPEGCLYSHDPRGHGLGLGHSF